MCHVVPCGDVAPCGTVRHRACGTRAAPACHVSLDLSLLPWTSPPACLPAAPPPGRTSQLGVTLVYSRRASPYRKTNSPTKQIHTISSVSICCEICAYPLKAIRESKCRKRCVLTVIPVATCHSIQFAGTHDTVRQEDGLYMIVLYCIIVR